MCLAYELIMGAELNFGSIFKSSIRKVWVPLERRYAFGGFIIELCRHAGVTEEPLDYFLQIVVPYYNLTDIKGPVVFGGPMFTTTERAHKDELIMGRMFWLEMSRHRIGSRPST